AEIYSAAPKELSQALDLSSAAPEGLDQEATQVLDLSDEISNFHQQLGPPARPAQELSFETLANPTGFHKDEPVMASTESTANNRPQFTEASASSADTLQRAEFRFDLPAHSATGNPTDRLSAFFNELVDSALQAKLLGLVEALG